MVDRVTLPGLAQSLLIGPDPFTNGIRCPFLRSRLVRPLSYVPRRLKRQANRFPRVPYTSSFEHMPCRVDALRKIIVLLWIDSRVRRQSARNQPGFGNLHLPRTTMPDLLQWGLRGKPRRRAGCLPPSRGAHKPLIPNDISCRSAKSIWKALSEWRVVHSRGDPEARSAVAGYHHQECRRAVAGGIGIGVVRR